MCGALELARHIEQLRTAVALSPALPAAGGAAGGCGRSRRRLCREPQVDAMTFLRVVLLLPVLLAQGSPQPIESCKHLKATIEGATSASSALALQLRSNALYTCTESIHVGAAQSVVITGGGEGLPAVFFSLQTRSPMDRPSSLFVNEGSLKLSNISVELYAARDEPVEGAGGVDSRRQEKERQSACAGVGLIRNSGHAVVENSHVFESGPSVDSKRRRCGEKGARHGRVVSVCAENKGKGHHGGGVTGVFCV